MTCVSTHLKNLVNTCLYHPDWEGEGLQAVLSGHREESSKGKTLCKEAPRRGECRGLLAGAWNVGPVKVKEGPRGHTPPGEGGGRWPGQRLGPCPRLTPITSGKMSDDAR